MNPSFLSQNISRIFWQNLSRELDSPCMLHITSTVVLALKTSSIEMTYPLNICFSTNTLVFYHQSSAFSPKNIFCFGLLFIIPNSPHLSQHDPFESVVNNCKSFVYQNGKYKVLILWMIWNFNTVLLLDKPDSLMKPIKVINKGIFHE